MKRKKKQHLKVTGAVGSFGWGNDEIHGEKKLIKQILPQASHKLNIISTKRQFYNFPHQVTVSNEIGKELFIEGSIMLH